MQMNIKSITESTFSNDYFKRGRGWMPSKIFTHKLSFILLPTSYSEATWRILSHSVRNKQTLYCMPRPLPIIPRRKGLGQRPLSPILPAKMFVTFSPPEPCASLIH